MMDLRPVAEWAGEIDDPDDYRADLSGTYSGSLTGKANVQSWGEGEVTDVVYDEANNETTFVVENLVRIAHSSGCCKTKITGKEVIE